MNIFIKKRMIGMGLILFISHPVYPMQPSVTLGRFFKNLPVVNFVSKHKYLTGISAATAIVVVLPGSRRHIRTFLNTAILLFSVITGLEPAWESEELRIDQDPEYQHNLRINQPFDFAVRHKDITLLRQLVQEAKDLEVVPNSCIYRAVREGCAVLVDILIKAGVPLDTYDEFKELPIHIAAEKGNIDCLKLLARACDVYARTVDGREIIAMPIITTDIEKYLSEKTAEEKKIFIAGLPARLTLAQFIEEGHYTKYIVECLQSIEQSTQELVLAVDNQNPELAFHAINSGAIVVRKNRVGDTPLHKAVGHYDPKSPTSLDEIARLIVQAIGRQIRYMRNARGQTPLHLAAMQGNIRLMQLFVRFGADVDSPDTFGNTPSHYAHDLSTIFFLVDNHADLSIRNNEDAVPVQPLFTLSKYPVENQ